MKVEREGKLLGREKQRITKLEKSISFKQWCCDNLSECEGDELLSRWDYNKNKLNPEDISYGSHGLNGRGYWFKCLDHSEHVSEQKSIHNFIRGHKGSVTCNQCNSISTTHPELIKYLVNKDDALKYSSGNAKTKISMKCIDCGFEKRMLLSDLVRRGFSCSRCSEHTSYPEKYFYGVLEQLIDIKFTTQLSIATFDWCGNYQYDFYIEHINCIIETHGLQHYKENKNWILSLKEIQENDKLKEHVSKDNGIENYIVLDCRQSNISWIKNSIMSSKLPQVLDFKEDDINWLKCHEFACSNIVKKVCNLWDGSVDNISIIGRKMKLGRQTILKYLKQGAELGWCDYDPKEEKKKYYISLSAKLCKQIICLTTKEVFCSREEAGKKYIMKSYSGISACCNNGQKSAGKHPITNEKLEWMYYDKYIATITTEGRK